MNKLTLTLLVSILIIQSIQAEGFLSKVNLDNQIIDIQSSAEFFTTLNDNEFVIAMLAAKYSGFNQAKSIFSELSNDYTNVKFLNVNLDIYDNQYIEQQYVLNVIPSYILFQNGTIVSQEGQATKSQLIEMLSIIL